LLDDFIARPYVSPASSKAPLSKLIVTHSPGDVVVIAFARTADKVPEASIVPVGISELSVVRIVVVSIPGMEPVKRSNFTRTLEIIWFTEGVNVWATCEKAVS